MLFSDAHTFVTHELLYKLEETDPAAINHGSCDTWANMMAVWVGGFPLWIDTIIDADEFPLDELPRVGHCVLVFEGRYYDSEHPAGVESLLALAGFDEEQCLRYAEFDLPAAAWLKGAP
jgi:hypothetical protein